VFCGLSNSFGQQLKLGEPSSEMPAGRFCLFWPGRSLKLVKYLVAFIDAGAGSLRARKCNCIFACANDCPVAQTQFGMKD
jgi:hypothetical protein